MARLFFALWPEEETRKQIDHVASEFKNQNIKCIKKSNLHITLEFLGEVTEEDQEALIEKIDKLQFEPFEIELTRIGWWRKPQILWIGTTHIPEELTRLVKASSNSMGV